MAYDSPANTRIRHLLQEDADADMAITCQGVEFRLRSRIISRHSTVLARHIHQAGIRHFNLQDEKAEDVRVILYCIYGGSLPSALRWAAESQDGLWPAACRAWRDQLPHTTELPLTLALGWFASPSNWVPTPASVRLRVLRLMHLSVFLGAAALRKMFFKWFAVLCRAYPCVDGESIRAALGMGSFLDDGDLLGEAACAVAFTRVEFPGGHAVHRALRGILVEFPDISLALNGALLLMSEGFNLTFREAFLLGLDMLGWKTGSGNTLDGLGLVYTVGPDGEPKEIDFLED